jgi:hypothetical protein
MDAFRQLQVLGLMCMALLIAPTAVPVLRPHSTRLRIAALALYLTGGLAILLLWLFAPA